ncbi:hypothetical protein L1887_35513 [Cichorium endivia]|nr:hypothetical protein L1887_35513 [Cichorium endivia]
MFQGFNFVNHDAILDKKLCSTVALFAGTARGKSAALGLAIARVVAVRLAFHLQLIWESWMILTCPWKRKL